MVYIDTVYIFRKDNDIDYWDLAPEGTGLEAWSEDEDLFDQWITFERFTVEFKFSLNG